MHHTYYAANVASDKHNPHRFPAELTEHRNASHLTPRRPTELGTPLTREIYSKKCLWPGHTAGSPNNGL